MKWAVLLLLLINSVVAATAQDCRSLSDAPANLAMLVKDGGNSADLNKILGKGKTFSQAQWSQRIHFKAASFDVSIAPVAACSDGLELNVDDSGNVYNKVVPWDTKVTLTGDPNSSHFVEVTASRLSP
jgi:hypothetical protein